MTSAIKHTLLLSAGVALITASTLSFAEPDRAAHFFERMKEKLSLTDTQSEQVKEIMQTQRTKKEALREETDAKIKAVLTPEQVEKLDAMRAKHENWRGKKGLKGHKGDCDREK